MLASSTLCRLAESRPVVVGQPPVRCCRKLCTSCHGLGLNQWQRSFPAMRGWGAGWSPDRDPPLLYHWAGDAPVRSCRERSADPPSRRGRRPECARRPSGPPRSPRHDAALRGSVGWTNDGGSRGGEGWSGEPGGRRGRAGPLRGPGGSPRRRVSGVADGRARGPCACRPTRGRTRPKMRRWLRWWDRRSGAPSRAVPGASGCASGAPGRLGRPRALPCTLVRSRTQVRSRAVCTAPYGAGRRGSGGGAGWGGTTRKRRGEAGGSARELSGLLVPGPAGARLRCVDQQLFRMDCSALFSAESTVRS
ncbi:hypothetical protein GA0115234_1056342 [Streptomyces sp. DvalAA-43]|nr:hypothetical protein GA0115234_1056342 [Streptomyces sp. DvalAA-43]